MRRMLRSSRPRRYSPDELPTWRISRSTSLGAGTAKRGPSSRPSTKGSGTGRGKTVTYFWAEFGIHNSVPIYSSGLGVLAATI